MLLFAIFTIGYFFGVFTALAIFPPRVKEIEEQEIDAASPVLSIENVDERKDKSLEGKGTGLEYPVAASV